LEFPVDVELPLPPLLHEMVKRDARKGIASLCIGGGMGVALTVER
jgi:acetyl-CoA C-acetyltransferase